MSDPSQNTIGDTGVTTSHPHDTSCWRLLGGGGSISNDQIMVLEIMSKIWKLGKPWVSGRRKKKMLWDSCDVAGKTFMQMWWYHGIFMGGELKYYRGDTLWSWTLWAGGGEGTQHSISQTIKWTMLIQSEPAGGIFLGWVSTFSR